ncbi:MAG: rRNA maturation RNase YbeY [Sphingomonadales bacterium]
MNEDPDSSLPASPPAVADGGAESEPPGIGVAFRISDEGWQDLAASLELLAEESARKAVIAALGKLGLALPSGGLEVGLLFAGDEEIQGLNREYRGIDKATNVLSFPAIASREEMDWELNAAVDGRPLIIGDVALARETILSEADGASKDRIGHLQHLIVHGVLHLFGFDHDSPAEADIMETLEVKILAELGVADPYRRSGAAEALDD